MPNRPSLPLTHSKHVIDRVMNSPVGSTTTCNSHAAQSTAVEPLNGRTDGWNGERATGSALARHSILGHTRTVGTLYPGWMEDRRQGTLRLARPRPHMAKTSRGHRPGATKLQSV